MPAAAENPGTPDDVSTRFAVLRACWKITSIRKR
jgi:hypothetical protein